MAHEECVDALGKLCAHGGASCDVYDGEAIAKKGVVYVDCNYRVGIFGFLASSELSAEDPDKVSGNYAIKDLIAALQSTTSPRPERTTGLTSTTRWATP